MNIKTLQELLEEGLKEGRIHEDTEVAISITTQDDDIDAYVSNYGSGTADGEPVFFLYADEDDKVEV